MFRDVIDLAILEMRESGELERLFYKWFLNKDSRCHDNTYNVEVFFHCFNCLFMKAMLEFKKLPNESTVYLLDADEIISIDWICFRTSQSLESFVIKLPKKTLHLPRFNCFLSEYFRIVFYFGMWIERSMVTSFNFI